MKTSLARLMMIVALTGIAAETAHANEPFRKKHPRRAEVNRNVNRERNEIKRDVKEGKLTQAQGQQDLKDLRNVKQNERADVKANGGYLTKDQQKGLNQELRDNQQQINQQVKADHAAAPVQPVAPSTSSSN